jgi:hypothetical protein
VVEGQKQAACRVVSARHARFFWSLAIAADPRDRRKMTKVSPLDRDLPHNKRISLPAFWLKVNGRNIVPPAWLAQVSAFQHRGTKPDDVEITVFAKRGGALSKRISLNKDGTLNADGSACVMAKGEARRVKVRDAKHLAELIGAMEPNQALALGTPRRGLDDTIKIVTAAKLGEASSDTCARTADDIVYRHGTSAFVLHDFDTKGMPPHVRAKVEEAGGFWPALVSVLPELAGAALVTRGSTSSGLSRSDTDEKFEGTKNVHAYVLVADGADAVRYLRALHDRCWLKGFGWQIVDKAGGLLERSIVDRSVGGSERLVFEGGPVLVNPLVQDKKARKPVATEGGRLETRVCRELTLYDRALVKVAKDNEAARLAPAMAMARTKYIEEQTNYFVKYGMAIDRARGAAKKMTDGILLPIVVLPFDDEKLAGTTVAQVLADPQRYLDAKMADPIEGVEYGRGKAKVMIRDDGTVFINSFAHGGRRFSLTLDKDAVKAEIEKVDAVHAGKKLAELLTVSDLDAQDMEELRTFAAARAGVGKLIIKALIKQADAFAFAERAKDERKRRTDARVDPRPEIEAPPPDDPWIPQMETVRDVLVQTSEQRWSIRDMDNEDAAAVERTSLEMHAFTNANNEEDA